MNKHRKEITFDLKVEDLKKESGDVHELTDMIKESNEEETENFM